MTEFGFALDPQLQTLSSTAKLSGAANLCVNGR